MSEEHVKEQRLEDEGKEGGMQEGQAEKRLEDGREREMSGKRG